MIDLANMPLNADRTGRTALIAACVLVFHVAAIWALQSGLLRRAIEVIVPVQILGELIAPPVPPVEAPLKAPPKPAPPVMQSAVKTKVPVLPRPPELVAASDAPPAPNAPTAQTTPQPPPPAIGAPVAAVAVPAPPPPAPAPQPKIELPVVDADYAANEDLFRPTPASRRLREYGRVMLAITVGANGFASKVDLLDSSGHARLDDAAIAGARKLKFRPATRNGIAIEWAYKLPVIYPEPH